jgi:hypothetical protein
MNIKRREFLLKGMFAAGILAVDSSGNASPTPGINAATATPSPPPVQPTSGNGIDQQIGDAVKQIDGYRYPVEARDLDDITIDPPLSCSGDPTRGADKQKAFDSFVKTVRDTIPISENLEQPFDNRFLQLDRAIGVIRPRANSGFRYQQVESLLDQTADLVERALQDRATYNYKAAQALLLRLEMEQFFLSDTVHEEEVAAGFYCLAFDETLAEARQASARLQRAIDNAWRLDPVMSGAPNDWASQTAKWEAANEIGTAGCEAAAQKIQAEYLLETKLKWDFLNAAFQKTRDDIKRSIADKKAAAAAQEHGVLNFIEQMVPIGQRFKRDFQDVMDRVPVISNGLNLLFGYPDEVSGAPMPDPAADGFFDDYLLWVRNAIAWLIQFSRLDETYVMPVSIRALLGDQVFEAGKQTGEWSCEIEEAMFPNQRHIRLRGISVYSIENGNGGTWQTTISPPPQSFCRHLSGKIVTLDQTMVPVCRIGRVYKRDTTRQVDVAGTKSFRNISPLGNWRIAFGVKSLEGVKASGLEDVQMDLFVSCREA